MGGGNNDTPAENFTGIPTAPNLIKLICHNDKIVVPTALQKRIVN